MNGVWSELISGGEFPDTPCIFPAALKQLSAVRALLLKLLQMLKWIRDILSTEQGI